MKNILLALLAVVLTCSCSGERAHQKYDNPTIGLQLTYPGSWRIVKKDTLNDALAAAEDVTGISQETADITRELAPSIILTLSKSQRIDGVDRNPNINVLVIPVPEEEWKDVDMNALVQEQIADIRASIPGSEVTENVFPLSDYPTVHNYSSRMPLRDRTVTQYQYVYWRPPYFVQVAFTFSHPDDESELKDIVRSMKIAKSNKSDAGDGK